MEVFIQWVKLRIDYLCLAFRNYTTLIPSIPFSPQVLMPWCLETSTNIFIKFYHRGEWKSYLKIYKCSYLSRHYDWWYYGQFLQTYTWFWTKCTFSKMFWDYIHWDLFQKKSLEGMYIQIIHQKYFHNLKHAFLSHHAHPYTKSIQKFNRDRQKYIRHSTFSFRSINPSRSNVLNCVTNLKGFPHFFCEKGFKIKNYEHKLTLCL